MEKSQTRKTIPILILSVFAVTVSAAELPRAQTILVNKMSKEAGISLAERRQIVSSLASDPDADWEQDRASELRYFRVSLSVHRTDGILVSSHASQDCGATGNCPVWLFKSGGGRVKLILSNAFADRIGIQNSTNHGLRNLVLWANQSAQTSEVDVFTFDGERYLRSRCYQAKEDGISPGEVRLIECPAQ